MAALLPALRRIMPKHLDSYFLCNRRVSVRACARAHACVCIACVCTVRAPASHCVVAVCAQCPSIEFLPLVPRPSKPMKPLRTLPRARSGSEAVENAVKIARAATGRQAVIAFDVRRLARGRRPPGSRAAPCPLTAFRPPSLPEMNRQSAPPAHPPRFARRAAQGGFHGRTLGAMALTSSKVTGAAAGRAGVGARKPLCERAAPRAPARAAWPRAVQVGPKPTPQILNPKPYGPKP
jgi:hypothetical protein